MCLSIYLHVCQNVSQPIHLSICHVLSFIVSSIFLSLYTSYIKSCLIFGSFPSAFFLESAVSSPNSPAADSSKFGLPRLGDRQDLYELALLSALPWTGKDFHYSLNNSIKTLIFQSEIFLLTIGNFLAGRTPLYNDLSQHDQCRHLAADF